MEINERDSKTYKINEVKEPLLVTNIPHFLKNWMTNISEKLQNIPIWKLTIPGSHDSGSYGLDTSYGISPDRPDLQNSLIVRICSCFSMPAIHRWTKTQTLDLTNQLNAGIRYFDFRVASKTNDNNLYFCHGLYGPQINQMLTEINAFLMENPREIVFLDFQHFYGVSDEDHKQLIESIVKTFGKRLVPYKSQLMMGGLTLSKLWDRKQQVFVYYREESARMENPILWPSRCLPNPWPNTMSKQKLIGFLTQNISIRPLNSMFVAQGILTPSNNYVGFHLLTSLESDLANDCNFVLSDWLKSTTAGSKGPNIVMTDFVEWNHFQIPIETIRLNNTLENIKN